MVEEEEEEDEEAVPAMGAPQLLQNRTPGASGLPQFVQKPILCTGSPALEPKKP
jgi:hypothetical protein